MTVLGPWINVSIATVKLSIATVKLSIATVKLSIATVNVNIATVNVNIATIRLIKMFKWQELRSKKQSTYDNVGNEDNRHDAICSFIKRHQ